MKRVKIAVAFLILIPVLIFSLHIYLRRVTQDMSATLAQAQTLMDEGKNKEAAKQVAAFTAKWDHSKGVLATFIKHSELDTVNLSSARLMPYITHEETGDFDAESDSLQVQLHHLWEIEKFSIDNIL